MQWALEWETRGKKRVCMCAYASKSSSLSTGHRYTTQILNQLCSYEIHVNWNALIANQFTKAYFKALLLWYTLLRVNTLKPLARALIERHYTVGLHDISHAIVMRISSVKPVLWFVINLHHLFSNLMHRAVVHREATQYHVQYRRPFICDSERELHSLSVNYGSVY